jgi:hypothetical protein
MHTKYWCEKQKERDSTEGDGVEWDNIKMDFEEREF